jgi:hypothetical protein
MATSHPYYNAGSSSAIPVVQGQVVSAPGSTQAFHQSYTPALVQPGNYYDYSQHEAGTTTTTWTHGEKQPKNYKDIVWAILFYGHLGLIAFATITYTPTMVQDMENGYANGGYRRLSSETTQFWSSVAVRFLEEDYSGNGQDAEFNLDLTAVLIILCFACLTALLVSSGAVALMMTFPKQLIIMSLIFQLCVMGAMAVMALMAGAYPMLIPIGFMFLLSVCYIQAVWSRIPFAAANLTTAITAIKSNMGLTFFAFNNLFITFLWSVWWSTCFVAASYVLSGCNAEGYCENEMNGFLTFLFLVSFFWTAQVIKNVVHVTVAGTVGTWWLFPHEANGCCSQAVRDSYWRSITTSFGSICLGSLIVALIQACREIVTSMRQNEDSALLWCIADFLLGCLERMAEYFNKVRRDVQKSLRCLITYSVIHNAMVVEIISIVGIHICWTLWIWLC